MPFLTKQYISDNRGKVIVYTEFPIPNYTAWHKSMPMVGISKNSIK